MTRLDRAVDNLSPKLKELRLAQDGPEINAWLLEREIARCRHLGECRHAFEQFRDGAAERYRSDTGNTWRPRHGSHLSRTSLLTSAAINARDFLRARQNETARLPQGMLLAVFRSKPVDDANRTCAALDNVRAKVADMVLVYVGPSTLYYALALVWTDNHRVGAGQSALLPSAGPWIAWDDKLTGLGVRVQPSGTKSSPVNYRANGGGRYSPNRRMVEGRFGRMTVEQARREARVLLGRVAAGEDPAATRAEARGLPTLGEAFEEYPGDNPNRTYRTNTLYQQNLRVDLSDWINRSLSAISRRNVKRRIHRTTEYHGWAGVNQTLSMLRFIYRRPCVNHDGLKNRVELWPLRAGGSTATAGEGFQRHPPFCLAGARELRRRRTARNASNGRLTGWVFPSELSRTGHVVNVQAHNAAITESGGEKFWFHGLRNRFNSVAERELILPRSLTKRLANHARSHDVTEGYAADWAVEQLREPAQRVADRKDDLRTVPVRSG